MTARTNTPTTIPGLPKPPASTSPELRRYLEALAEAVEVRLGRRGDPRDRAVTVRDLVESGLAVEPGSYYVYNSSASASYTTPFLPAGRAPNSSISAPTVPTNLTATAGLEVIVLFWDFPTYGGHSVTEIWRHDEDIIGDAQLIAITAGTSYSDYVGDETTYYYWIRHTNQLDVSGNFNSANGVTATTQKNVDLLVNELSGAITESELATTLSNRINLVDAADTVVNSVAYRVAQEAALRASAITTLQAQVDDLLAITEYDNAVTYAINDQVSYNSKLYKATAVTTGNLPTDTNFWDLLGDYTSLGESVGNNAAAIIELNTVSASTTSANAQALYALQGTVAGNTASITALNNVAVDSTSATAQALFNLNAAVTDATTGLAATRATLINDYYTSAGTDSAITTATTGLVSSTDLTTALGDYTTTATLTSDYYTSAQADSAISTAITDLVSSTDLTTALGDYTTTASLESNYYTSTEADSAISTAITGLVSSTDLTTALGDYTTTATLESDYYTATEADSAISAATTNLVSTTALSTALGDYTTTASLESNYYTSTEADSAISTAVNTLATTVNGNTAAISTQATSINGLSAQYTVKIDNNGYVTGYGLASTVVDGTPTSEFIVRADRFAITSTGGTEITPFVVTTTETTLNGVTVPAGVYIDQAYIKNGAISTAQIGDAVITNAKISDLSAEKINAGTIDTSRLNIDNSTLTSSGGVLQVGNINASSITAGSIAAGVMSGTTVFANKLEGDVNQIDYFNVPGGTGVPLSTSGYADLFSVLIPAGTHPEGHVPVVIVNANSEVTNNGELRFRVLMDELGGVPPAVSIGPITQVVNSPYNYSVLIVAGNKTDRVLPGGTVTNNTVTQEVASVYYNSGGNVTNISVLSISGFSVGDPLYATEPSGFVPVGESFLGAPTAGWGYTVNVLGSLNRKCTNDVLVTLQGRIIDGTGYVINVNGLTMGLS